MAQILALEKVTKLYGSVIGVNDISITLAPGAYGLLGPNGSGKTTFLNLLTGQLRPTLGSVSTLGMRPWNCAAVLRRVGLCPASDIPYASISAHEWVTHLLELYGFDRSEARDRAARSLEEVGMASAMHRRMGTYSRGMRQRAKLAQAFAHEPELLILDEPFNGLDPVGRHEMTERMRAWIANGRSVILASHVLHEVEAVSSVFLLISGGRLLASGGADEIRELLAGLAHEVRIRSDASRQLAQRLIEAGLATGIKIDEAAGTVVVTTPDPLRLYQTLPRWAADGLSIRELRSADESLQALFESLLRIHRGAQR